MHSDERGCKNARYPKQRSVRGACARLRHRKVVRRTYVHFVRRDSRILLLFPLRGKSPRRSCSGRLTRCSRGQIRSAPDTCRTDLRIFSSVRTGLGGHRGPARWPIAHRWTETPETERDQWESRESVMSDKTSDGQTCERVISYVRF